MAGDIRLDDPDMAFLTAGGFAYYDASGRVLSALALAARDTGHFMHFGAPVPLPVEDANRCDGGGRGGRLLHACIHKCMHICMHALDTGYMHYTYTPHCAVNGLMK
jgi:hypothetical protein